MPPKRPSDLVPDSLPEKGGEPDLVSDPLPPRNDDLRGHRPAPEGGVEQVPKSEGERQ